MYFVKVIYLYLKDIVMVLTKTKHNDNMITNCEKLNLNMRKMTHFSQFLVSVTLTLTLSIQFMKYSHTF